MLSDMKPLILNKARFAEKLFHFLVACKATLQAGCHKVREHASGACRKLARLVGREGGEEGEKKGKEEEGKKKKSKKKGGKEEGRERGRKEGKEEGRKERK